MIEYVTGDATAPKGDGKKIIAHICNDVGAWGAGFVMAISRKWPQPEDTYRKWMRSKPMPKLGDVDLVRVEPDIWVANMIAQAGVGPDAKGRAPVRYNYLDRCLFKVAVEAATLQASVHMPRIGCGLAGGTWDKIEPLINESLIQQGVSVTVYDFPAS